MERLTIKAPSGLIHLKDDEEMTVNMAIKKLSDFEDLQEKLNKHFNGCVTMEMIVDAIIEYDKQFERDEKLADAMLITNGSVRKYRKWKKKNTPQKVIYEDVGYDHYRGVNVYACICPCCGVRVIQFDDDDIPNCKSDEPKEMFHSCLVHHAYMGLNNFCNRCGQKLDWK